MVMVKLVSGEVFTIDFVDYKKLFDSIKSQTQPAQFLVINDTAFVIEHIAYITRIKKECDNNE